LLEQLLSVERIREYGFSMKEYIYLDYWEPGTLLPDWYSVRGRLLKSLPLRPLLSS
jgi:hypothetical protein